MPLFLWKKSYEIGVPEIDDQHRQLVDLINELADAMNVKEGYKIVGDVLDRLVDYTQFHFSTEEELMEEKSYPELSNHRYEHSELTRKALEYQKTHADENKINLGEFLTFLCDWLRAHLAESDKMIGIHIKDTES